MIAGNKNIIKHVNVSLNSWITLNCNEIHFHNRFNAHQYVTEITFSGLKKVYIIIIIDNNNNYVVI